MNEPLSIFTIILLLNSLILTLLILNQNENTKDATTRQTQSLSNPLEKFTWVSLISQLVLLLINVKISDS